jgi:lipid-binding SYLF domain-containing protein
MRGFFLMRVTLSLLLTALLCMTAAHPVAAAETDRLNNAAEVVRELRAAPDRGIPEELWSRAECVIVIPSMKKAAFMIGAEFGRGVMSCRSRNGWGAPVYMELAKGSWGLQIGAESVDLVLLVMNRNGIDKLLDNKIALGVDAAVSAGPVGRSAGAGTDAQLHAQILSYSRSKGLFAGIDLSGGVLRPDESANREAYGTKAPHEILAGVPDMASRDFVSSLGRDVRATTGTK